MRLLLADDERQRYSAWYTDYSSTAALLAPPAAAGLAADDNQNPGAATGLTRSQQLLGLSPAAATSTMSPQAGAINSLASVVDLQIALITALPTVTKPMQVRLTRRSQCSELRGYSNQGSISSISSSSFPVPSYAAPSASSASSINSQLPGQPSLVVVCALVLTLWQATAVQQQIHRLVQA